MKEAKSVASTKDSERSTSFVAQCDRDKMLKNQDHSALVLWIELAFGPFLCSSGELALQKSFNPKLRISMSRNGLSFLDHHHLNGDILTVSEPSSVPQQVVAFNPTLYC